jgi:PadR family transcriptional regulator, regulatory protein PadR
MSTPRFPIPQGTLDMLILKVLSLEPAHGYGIAQRVQQVSRNVVQLNQGSLYPALHRLEQKRWLKSEWRPSETGREAKFYSLTRAGEKQLALEKATWDRLTAAVDLIFNEGG